MPRRSDLKTFRNEDLKLRVSESVDPAVWDNNKYEAFFDALCESRDYQAEALRTSLRYLLGGRYPNLRALAEENFNSYETLQERYGTFDTMERMLLLPEALYASIDLATGTGKSFVLYGLAAVLLAEGTIDQVLVLCPSNTIEAGLIEKFRELSGNSELTDALPEGARFRNPRIIRADESIQPGCICVENFHAVLAHVKSSVREGLKGKGARTLVLNDEIHHVASKKGKDQNRWKEFLSDPQFGFHRIIGGSGTCYVDDDYFADVISQYSLRRATEDKFVKDIAYVTEEELGNDSRERFQIIYDNHKKNKQKYRSVKPLTIFVTRDIDACDELAEDWIEFLAEHEGIGEDKAREKVLVVTSAPKHVPNVTKLPTVDNKGSKYEWIMSVSMLSEGWDVKNVFQIVPSEERAFNSKLLISQVLGRGLRVPLAYTGQKVVVTVFNHDKWSKNIKHLVDEVLEREKRLTSRPIQKQPDFHFTLHTINYSRQPESETYVQEKEYELLKKGFVRLPSQESTIDREVEYEQVGTGERQTRKTSVAVKMYTVDEVAAHVFQRLKTLDDESQSLPENQRTSHSKKYTLSWLRKMVKESVERVGEKSGKVSEENRQKILQSFGTLNRGEAKTVRYKLRPEKLVVVETASRPASSVGYNILKRIEATVFWSPDSASSFRDDELAVFHEVTGEDSEIPPKAIVHVANAFNFKTPLNIVIAESDPERKFVRRLCETENAAKIDRWIKSTDRDFYPIEFSWKTGEHTKRGSFNPDFFIKVQNKIRVIEVKDDSQVDDPSEENKKKAQFAREHFALLNQEQKDITYVFNFLTPMDYEVFFQKLRSETLDGYQSHLDAALGS